MVRILVAALITVAVGFGGHMATCEEDTCVVWVCQVQGNGRC